MPATRRLKGQDYGQSNRMRHPDRHDDMRQRYTSTGISLCVRTFCVSLPINMP